MYMFKEKKKSGFALAEIMVVVALLAILAGLAIPNIIAYQRSSRLQELDHYAQELFLSAQNRLTAQKNSGTIARLSNTTNPNAAQLVAGVPALAGYQAYYLTKANIDELLATETLEGALFSGEFYVIYDQPSASVMAVLYSQTPFGYDTGYEAVGLDVKTRIARDLWVGWYTGLPASSEDVLQLDAPTCYIKNGEKLIAEIIVSTPDSLAVPLSSIDLHASIGGVTLPLGTPVPVGSSRQKYTIILDSLLPGEPRFQALATGVTPGESFTITTWATSSTASVKESTYSYATDNSLFDQNSTADVAYLRTARHLQNLDTSSGVTATINSAVQTANIRFDDTGLDDSWHTYYTQQGVAFRPINNPNLNSYSGYYAANMNQNTITGLTASAASAGLFDTFSGTSLSGIYLINTKLTGTTHAGALAGRTTAPVTVSNCQVYHSYVGSSVKTELGTHTNYQITAPIAGGLVGHAAAKLTIQNSLSATLIQGTTIGGFVGSAQGADIASSYSDCYFAGTQVGGLVGELLSAGTVKSSYTAGFVISANRAAGLIYGAAAVENSYSALSYLPGISSIAPLITGGSASDAYYLTTPGTLNTIGTALAGTALQTQTITGFSPAGSVARPYNLMDGLGLRNYTFPTLTLPHYGDWRAEFASGTLVYYEHYQNSYQGRNYGFYGGNLDMLPAQRNGGGAIIRPKNVVPDQDGYSVVFTELPTSLSYTYKGTTRTLSLASPISFLGTDPYGTTVTYYLIPLPAAVINTTNASNQFYQEITLTVDGISTLYDFNPHFANTATPRGGATAPPTMSDETIVLRSPRHLYALSYFSSTYAVNNWGFVQELNLDYNTYNWNGTGFTSAMSASTRVQAPIGAEGSGKAFTGIYNGSDCTISNISVTDATKSVGLFGVNAGTLRNVLYISPGSTMTYTGDISGLGSTVYLGGLVGRNTGTVVNCAVGNLSISASNVKNSTLYLGGLVGFNDGGLIRQSTAASDQLESTSIRANSYAAGFVGLNSGTITRCYAQGAINVSRDTSGIVVAAGFAAKNTGAISSSYCAVALFADRGAQEAAFCWNTDAQQSSNFYLTDGNYTFDGQTFGLTYHDGSGARGLTQLQLAQQSIPGMTLAPASTRVDTDGDGVIDEIIDSATYPYPMVLSKHYGPWLRRLDLGDIGVCYWEKEEKSTADGGTAESYRFSFVGVSGAGSASQQTRADTTLCNYHDDGGVITDYGYGYYYRLSGSTTATLSSSSLLNTDASSFNPSAQAALQIQMEGKYAFVAYDIYDPTTGKGLYPFELDELGNWTLSYKSKNYSFSISPFFASAMRFNSDPTTVTPGSNETNPFGIRSIEQLQFINWNADVKNCTTESQGNAGLYSYLAYADDQAFGHTYLQSHDLNATDVTNYAPIGSMSTWFAGKYNGNDYIIRNLSISSSARLVGLFGLVHGGTINNIIMHSDNGSVVESTYGRGEYSGVGALAGAALNQSSKVVNCAVSGYTIKRSNNSIDRSTAVGGLFGYCNIPLIGCTAVTDIEVSTTAANQDVYIGGLAGSVQCTISESYAGGSISYTGANAARLYQGGLIGYEKSPVTDLGGPGTTLYIRNSYSYVQMARSSNKTYVLSPTPRAPGTIQNSFFLKDVVDSSIMVNRGTPLIYKDFVDGTLLNGLNSGISGATRKFAPVTTVDNKGSAIDGKYSFPSRNDLAGRNYPFPSILTQENDQVTDNLARLHYGNWPEKGLLGSALAEVDLIATRPDGSSDTTKAITLTPTGLATNGTYRVLNTPTYDPTVVTATIPTQGGASGNTLTVQGLKEGYTTVTVEYTVGGASYKLEMEVAVTATVVISVQPASATLVSGSTTKFTAIAADKYGNSLHGPKLKWLTATSSIPAVADVTAFGPTTQGNFEFTVLSLNPTNDTQDTIFTVTADYTHPTNGMTYSGQGRGSASVIPVVATAAPVTLLVGNAPFSYGVDKVTVSIGAQTLPNVSITGVRMANSAIATASLDASTGKVSFAGVIAGQTHASLSLSFSKEGVNYTSTATVAITVTAPNLIISPSRVSATTGTGNFFQSEAALAYVANSGDTFSFTITATSKPAGAGAGSTSIDGGRGAITVNVPTTVLGDFTYTVTATRTLANGVTSTFSAPFTVSIISEPTLALQSAPTVPPIYGGFSQSVTLTLLDNDLPVTDWSGYTVTCSIPDENMVRSAVVTNGVLSITGAYVGASSQSQVSVTVSRPSVAGTGTISSSILVPVTVYPAPTLTAPVTTLDLAPPAPGMTPHEVPLSFTAFDENNFQLTLNEDYQATVATATLDKRTLKITPVATGTTTFTITATHKTQPNVTLSCSVAVTVTAPPTLTISLPSDEINVPLNRETRIPFALPAQMPSGITDFTITSVSATSARNRAQVTYAEDQLVFAGIMNGNDTLTVTMNYSFSYPFAGTTKTATGSAQGVIRTLTFTVTSDTTTYFYNNNTSAGLNILPNTACSVKITSGVPNITNWAIIDETDAQSITTVMTTDSGSRILTIHIDSPVDAGFVRLTGSDGGNPYSITILCELYKNPDSMALNIQKN